MTQVGSAHIPAETPILSASQLIAAALAKVEENQAAAEAVQDLQVALRVLSSLDPYLDDHSSAGPASLQPLLEATVDEDWGARYKEGKTTFPMSAKWSAGAYEGMFIANVARAVGAKRVLEVGMFTGTTTICIADNLPEDGKVVALELDAFLETFLSPHLERAGLRQKVEIRTGPAKNSIQGLVQELQSSAIPPFDLIFIDADKTGYQGYYDQIMQGGLLKVGGVFLIDNTLYSECHRRPQERREKKRKAVLAVQSPQRGRHLADLSSPSHTCPEASPIIASDPAAQKHLMSKVSGINKENADALNEFNKNVVKDKRVQITLLPVRDGLTWINRVE